jgi:putative FmdB family regulatory protein
LDKERDVPIYEYTCQSCKGKFEQLVRSMSAAGEAKVKCPGCGSGETARSMSVFAVSSSNGSTSSGSDAPMCGRCGGAPGSCAMG